MRTTLVKSMLRPVPIVIAVVGALFLIAGCASAPKKEKTAPELYEEARQAVSKGNYQKAIDTYRRLKNWYPYSPHAKDAELGIADAQFEIGEYDEAKASYESFERMHPLDPKVPYVIYRIGLCDYDRMKGKDRDPEMAMGAIEAFSRLVSRFPKSPYAKKASLALDECQHVLAAHELYVGKFYFKARKYKAAWNRFYRLVKKYPDTGIHYEAIIYLARCQKRLKDAGNQGAAGQEENHNKE